MFVKYSPKVPHMKVIPLVPVKTDKGDGYTFDNDTVTLRPGTNELTEQEWAAIQPHIKDQLGKEIEAFSVPVKKGANGKPVKAKTLKDVPIDTARKIIQGCQDPKTLKKWFNQDLPDEMLLVLSKRMRKLKIEPEDLDDENDSLKSLDNEITPESGGTSVSNTDGADNATGDTEDEGGKDDTDTETTNDDDGDGEGEGEDGGDHEDEDDEDNIPDFDGSRHEG